MEDHIGCLQPQQNIFSFPKATLHITNFLIIPSDFLPSPALSFSFWMYHASYLSILESHSSPSLVSCITTFSLELCIFFSVYRWQCHGVHRCPQLQYSGSDQFFRSAITYLIRGSYRVFKVEGNNYTCIWSTVKALLHWICTHILSLNVITSHRVDCALKTPFIHISTIISR